MIRFSRSLLYLLPVLFCGQLPLCAWDSCGHELVMAITWTRLNAKARQAVEESAQELTGPYGSYDPITLACWMDDIKGFHPNLAFQGLFKSWHYVNWGLQEGDPLPDFNPGTDNEKQGNVVQALKRVEVVLRGGTDPYIPSRAVACAMMIHLVGDVHQPLHTTTAFALGKDERWHQDEGANRVLVVNGPSDEAKFNLHFFWDAAWRASWDPGTLRVVLDPAYNDFGLHHAADVASLALALSRRPSPMTTPVHWGTSYLDWAKESHEIGCRFVYPELEKGEAVPAGHLLRQVRLSEDYVSLAHRVAEARLLLAAVRLAQVLNATIGADASNLTPPASYPPGPPSPDY